MHYDTQVGVRSVGEFDQNVIMHGLTPQGSPFKRGLDGKFTADSK